MDLLTDAHIEVIFTFLTRPLPFVTVRRSIVKLWARHFLVFQESCSYFIKKWKSIDFLSRPYENCAESEKKNETNWVRNYILLCKESSPWEKSLTSQLCLYLHIYFSIVASICFVEIDLCVLVHFSKLRCSVICKTSQTKSKICSAGFFVCFLHFLIWKYFLFKTCIDII